LRLELAVWVVLEAQWAEARAEPAGGATVAPAKAAEALAEG